MVMSLPFISSMTGAAGQKATATPAVMIPVLSAWLPPLFLLSEYRRGTHSPSAARTLSMEKSNLPARPMRRLAVASVMVPITRAPSAKTTTSPTLIASVTESSTDCPSSAVAEEII